ncbi:MAG: 5-carboxymethyl-2-hydroxymuconate isomerase, partial [Alphaproteobacteria bacterium]|nr:5-carboxymethyl-2-hydroxymuconate isomerase [Alphaproteobacteria bacterium]
MKLVTFTDNAGTRIGIAKDDGIVDLKKADADLPRDMITLMSEWSTHRATVERAASRKADVALASVKLEAPVPRPGKI